MRLKQLSFIAVAIAVIAAYTSAAMAAGQLTEYYFDWATSKEGASITSPCKTIPGLDIQRILDPIKGEDGCIFADGIEQREEFTIDLGKERLLGQVVFINSTATVYGEIKRVPNSLTISISTESAQGPWKTVFARDPADITDSFTLDNAPVRWLHFDLGVNKDGVGSRVGKAKIFKRYLLKSGPELMETFCNEFRRDADGLQDFWKAVDAQQWDGACDAIVEHYSHLQVDPAGEIAPRVQQWMENTLEDGGCVYNYGSYDWDWLRRKGGCPLTSIGLPPGGSTVFALLASAYGKSGDEAYAQQLERLLRDWLQDMPCPGVDRGQDGELIWGWPGLNASSRTLVFPPILARMFPVKESVFSRDMKINLLYSIWEHLGFLYTITPALGGNWLTNCNGSLFDSALKFPEFRQQKAWLEQSKSQFELSLSRDVHPSGKEKEDSTMYVAIASGQLLGQYDSIKKAGVTISPEAEQKMSRIYDCFAWMTYPDNSIPAVGDCMRDVPLGRGASVVPQDYLKLFDRPDMLYIDTHGKQGTTPAQASRAFSDMGYYVMRTGWDTKPYQDARQMFFKCSTTRGHGHPDQLEVTIYACGREILTDPGQPAYGQPIETQVRPTSCHSTVCVDGKDQEHVSGTENAWAADKNVDFVDAQCDTYAGLTHRRRIVFLKNLKKAPDYWVVRDTLSGSGEHKYDLNFHFSAEANPEVVSGSVCSAYPMGGNALIRLVDQSAQPEIVDSSIALILTLVPTKTLRYRKEQAAPASFDTIVFPYSGAKSPRVAAEYLTPDQAGGGAVCVRVTTDYGCDLILLSDKPGTVVSFDNGRIETDAAVAVIRQDKKLHSRCNYRFQGNYVKYDGKLITDGGVK